MVFNIDAPTVFDPTKEYFDCDKFTKNHNGKHIIFLGDSFTCGSGLLPEDTWAYKTYQKIKEKENVSGYYNISHPASSIIDAILSAFVYFEEFGNPDVVFFMTTEIERDLNFLNSASSFIAKDPLLIITMYKILENYCKQVGIKLYSFSWVKAFGDEIDEPEIRKQLKPDGKNFFVYFPDLWTTNSKKSSSDSVNLFKNCKTFYDYDEKEMMSRVWFYDKNTKDKTKSLWALDAGCHAGTSFHDFWSEFIYNKYVKDV